MKESPCLSDVNPRIFARFVLRSDGLDVDPSDGDGTDVVALGISAAVTVALGVSVVPSCEVRGVPAGFVIVAEAGLLLVDAAPVGTVFVGGLPAALVLLVKASVPPEEGLLLGTGLSNRSIRISSKEQATIRSRRSPTA